MDKFYHKLNLLLFLWLVGQYCCEVSANRTIDLCKETSVSPRLKETGYIKVDTSQHPFGFRMRCRIVFNLCASCRLWLQFKSSSIKDNRICYPSLSSTCFQNCHYLRVVDEIYNQNSTFLFKPLEEYTSLSNKVSVTLCNIFNKDLMFEVIFRVKMKIQTIEPSPETTIKSPGFPSRYFVNGENYMYYIKKPLYYRDLMVTFTDWIISPRSTLTVSNSTGTTVYYSQSPRPIFLSVDFIKITFDTGNQKEYPHSDKIHGFRATIVSRSMSTPRPRPSSNCGPNMILSNYSGILRFNPRRRDIYDCVWVILIQPPFTHVSVQLENFQSHPSTTVKFYEGVTSEGRYIATVNPDETFRYQNPNGFYIRLEGVMDLRDDFRMSFSSSNPGDVTCPNGFKCRNGFCIDITLQCDGIIHCKDKSDETNCFKDREPHYQTLGSNWSVSIIIPIVITIFIFIILCLFFIFVRRFRKISRIQVPHRRTRLSSAGRNVSQQYLQNHFGMNMGLEDEMDSPPTYEEVMNSRPPSGNWNLAFNWSQQDLRDTPVPPPPPYSEYMRENEVNVYNNITDNDTSDLSTIPNDSSSSNNCTDPISEDQTSVSESATDTLYLENIYATICETPSNNLDRWMVDRSTSTSEQEIDVDNNKISVEEPHARTQAVNTELPSLRKDVNEDTYQNSTNFSPPTCADSFKSNSVLAKEDATNNNVGSQTRSANGQILRSSYSRSMDMLPGSDPTVSLDDLHCGQDAVCDPGNKDGSFRRRNSYPSLILLTDRQLNNEVFV